MDVVFAFVIVFVLSPRFVLKQTIADVLILICCRYMYVQCGSLNAHIFGQRTTREKFNGK